MAVFHGMVVLVRYMYCTWNWRVPLSVNFAIGQFHMKKCNSVTTDLQRQKTKRKRRTWNVGQISIIKIRVIWWRLKWNIIQKLLCCRIQRNYSHLKCMVRILIAQFSGNFVTDSHMPRWSLNKRELSTDFVFKWWHGYLCTLYKYSNWLLRS